MRLLSLLPEHRKNDYHSLSAYFHLSSPPHGRRPTRTPAQLYGRVFYSYIAHFSVVKREFMLYIGLWDGEL
jgi:hypothetical protein